MASAPTLVPSGDTYLDDLRAAVARSKTTKENFQERAIALKIWAATLQQLGIDLEPYIPLDDVLAARWSSSILIDYEETRVNQAYFNAVDEGFALLEGLLAENGFVLPPAQKKAEAPTGSPDTSVYFGSTSSPYFYCVDREPGSDGKAKLKWKFNLTNKVEESTPAIINGKALVLSDDGYLYAIC